MSHEKKNLIKIYISLPDTHTHTYRSNKTREKFRLPSIERCDRVCEKGGDRSSLLVQLLALQYRTGTRTLRYFGRVCAVVLGILREKKTLSVPKGVPPAAAAATGWAPSVSSSGWSMDDDFGQSFIYTASTWGGLKNYSLISSVINDFLFCINLEKQRLE